MRIATIAALLLCLLAVPVFAQESSEATTKRVKEMEKANLVLQEDLARTQLELDNTKQSLKKALKAHDEEVAARKTLATAFDQEVTQRKALAEKLDLLQKQLADALALQTKNTQDNDNALKDKLALLEKALADQADQQAKETAALREATDKQFVAYKESLEKERADRQASEEENKKSFTKLTKDTKKNRTLTYVMGVLLGGAAIAK